VTTTPRSLAKQANHAVSGGVWCAIAREIASTRSGANLPFGVAARLVNRRATSRPDLVSPQL
jgi:hypothetical protein